MTQKHHQPIDRYRLRTHREQREFFLRETRINNAIHQFIDGVAAIRERDRVREHWRRHTRSAGGEDC